MAKKKRESNILGWIILGVIGLGIFQFGIMQNAGQRSTSAPSAAPRVATTQPSSTVSLSTPRFVGVASLNVRHTPSTSGPLIGTLPQGTPLKVLDRRNGWLLIDLSPTLEGWVSEHLTTTDATAQATGQRFVPPAALRAVVSPAP